MLAYTLRRLATAVVMLLAIALATFLLFFGTPKDPARALCGKPCSADQLAQVRAYLQLDHGVWWQFWEFLKGLVIGRQFGSGPAGQHCGAPCFGYSFPHHESASSLIWERLPVTVSISAGAAVLCLLLGIGLGTLAAIRPGSWIDRFATAFSMVGVAVPSFLIGLLVVLVLGFGLDAIPYSGYVPLTESPPQWAWHLIGPWLVLSVLLAAAYVRITRTQLLGELSAVHLIAMRARGVPAAGVTRHAIRGVLIPVLTMFGLDLAALLGGSVITERVFSLHGLGDLLLTSVTESDLGLVVAITMASAFFIIIANLCMDLLLPILDPRIRRG